MKTISFVVGDGETQRVALADNGCLSFLLSNFNALGLEDEQQGVLYLGFETLEDGQSYTMKPRPIQQTQQTAKRIIGSAEGCPALPPSPPRNGISRAETKLARRELVSRIITKSNPIMIIRSPPATGKYTAD